MDDERKIEGKKKENQQKRGCRSHRLQTIISIIFLIYAGACFLGRMNMNMDMAFAESGSHGGEASQHDKQPDEKDADFGEILEVEPFKVNLNDPGEKRYFKTKIALELMPGGSNEEAIKKRYQLREMIMFHLMNKSRDEIQETTGKITLRSELIMKINRVLKKTKVRNLYFTEFLVY